MTVLHEVLFYWERDLEQFAGVAPLSRQQAFCVLEEARLKGRQKGDVVADALWRQAREEETVELLAPRLAEQMPVWARQLSKLGIVHRIAVRAAYRAGVS